MLVRVRGGYEILYRNHLYRSGDEVDMDDDTYRGKSHLVDVVKKPSPPEKKEEPVVAQEDMDTQVHRAIVKPARTRSKK